MGQVRASMYLPAGYVKLEGATVNRSNYPRLVSLADAYSLWTDDTTNNPGLFGEGDGSTTMILPNWTGRMAQFAATAGGAVAAGLPNINGNFEVRNSGGAGRLGLTTHGAFYEAYTSSSVVAVNTASNYTSASIAGLNASLSNSIYGNATTVQPPAINTFAIMRY